jgi:hypothetical protein
MYTEEVMCVCPYLWSYVSNRSGCNLIKFVKRYVIEVHPDVVQICVAERRGYVLINASLGDFVVVRTRTYTNLEIIAYYTSRLYGIAYCS